MNTMRGNTVTALVLTLCAVACQPDAGDEVAEEARVCTPESSPTASAPSAGPWGSTSSGFRFVVAAGGTAIAAEPGVSSMTISLTANSNTNCPTGADFCSMSVTRHVYDRIPIVSGRFVWSDNEFAVSGVFCSARSAAGTISYKGKMIPWQRSFSGS
jgi:hypothetical protein